VADSRTETAAPLLTGFVLKQVKILHENALFLHRIFKNFLRRVTASSQARPIPFRSPLFQISGFATDETDMINGTLHLRPAAIHNDRCFVI